MHEKCAWQESAPFVRFAHFGSATRPAKWSSLLLFVAAPSIKEGGAPFESCLSEKCAWQESNLQRRA